MLAFVGALIAMDTTVTVIALPAIIADLGTTLPRGTWVTTGYVLGLITAIPLAGWLSGQFGDRRVYLTGLVVFVLASVGAGASPSVESLIVVRVVQGLGGGVLNPVGMAIAQRSVPADQRGRIMSLVGLAIFVGPVLGPAAGLLVDVASWRWLFWINLPLGGLAVLLCRRLLPASQRDSERGPVDWIGLVLVTTGCVGLVLACTSIGDSGRITVSTVLVAAGGLGLLGLFIGRSRRIDHPLVRVGLLARRRVASGAAILMCFGAGYFGAMTIIPAFVQGVRGDPVSVAGLLAIPAGAAVGLTLQVATRLVDRIEPRRVIMFGTATALTGAAALVVVLGLNSHYAVIGAASVLVGIGSGATLMPTMVAASRDLSGSDLPSATTLLNLCSQLGSAVGTALVASTMSLLVAARIDGLDAGGRSGLGAMVALEPVGRAHLSDQLARAVALSYLTPLVLMVIAFLVCAWGMPRPAVGNTHSRARSAVAAR